MAKVIRAGVKHIVSKIFEHQCSQCDSTIEFDQRTDLRSEQREGSWYTCPVCGAFIDQSVVERRR